MAFYTKVNPTASWASTVIRALFELSMKHYENKCVSNEGTRDRL